MSWSLQELESVNFKVMKLINYIMDALTAKICCHVSQIIRQHCGMD